MINFKHLHTALFAPILVFSTSARAADTAITVDSFGPHSAGQQTTIVYPHLATLSTFYKHYLNSDTHKVAPLFSLQDLMGQIRLYAVHTEHQLGNTQAWIGKSPEKEFFNIQQPQPFKPYLQKIVRPVGSTTSLFGDLHGSIKSVLANLQRIKKDGFIDDNFKIIHPDFYMLSLGDFVDRGDYGADVLYILMRLKNANPDRVFLVRGNHEDRDINAQSKFQGGGFEHELRSKFDPAAVNKNKDALYRLYDLMPVAIILNSGDRFGLCSHGGFEVGCNIRPLRDASPSKKYMWVGELKRADAIKAMPQSLQRELQTFPKKEVINFVPIAPMSPATLGYMWWDYNDNSENSHQTYYRNRRGWCCGKNLTEYEMKKMGINVILRAHQHNGNMLAELREQQGMVSLWDGKVFTFLSAPSIQGFRYDSFAILTTGQDQWKLELDSEPVQTGLAD